MDNIEIFLLIVSLIIFIAVAYNRSAKSGGPINKKLERFATQYGLTIINANSEIYLEGIFNGRSLTIETMTMDKEGWQLFSGSGRAHTKRTILLMKMSINHLPNTYLKLERFPYLTLPFIFEEDGILIKLQDRQEPTNLVRIVNIEEAEVIPGVLFDVQCDPSTLVSALFEKEPSLKNQLVQSFYSAGHDTIYAIEINSEQVILEKGLELSTDASLEMLAATMNKLATIVEQLQQTE